MKQVLKFYRCKHCGNLIMKLHNSGVSVICCGEEMEKLLPNTKEAAVEKHIPILIQEEDFSLIQVGEVLHPMTEEHHVEWVYVETKTGGELQYFILDTNPKVKISTPVAKIVKVYAYCNLHGLWVYENTNNEES